MAMVKATVVRRRVVYIGTLTPRMDAMPTTCTHHTTPTDSPPRQERDRAPPQHQQEAGTMGTAQWVPPEEAEKKDSSGWRGRLKPLV
jgi:hypothetical protein